MRIRARSRQFRSATSRKPLPSTSLETKGGGAPRGATVYLAASSGCGSGRYRGPLAFRRSTAGSLRRINASAQLRPRFLGKLHACGKISPASRRIGVIGCHPISAYPSPASSSQAGPVLPAGRCPEPPGSGARPPPAGTALALLQGSSREAPLTRASWGLSNGNGDGCQGHRHRKREIFRRALPPRFPSAAQHGAICSMGIGACRCPRGPMKPRTQDRRVGPARSAPRPILRLAPRVILAGGGRQHPGAAELQDAAECRKS